MEILSGEYISDGVQYTRSLGAKLGSQLKGGEFIALYGELGTGKTAFASGIAASLGIKARVTSPSFTILNRYSGRLELYHFDLYRVNDPEELFELGWDDALCSGGVCVVEWCENAGDMLPDEYIRVDFNYLADDGRKITISRPHRHANLKENDKQ